MSAVSVEELIERLGVYYARHAREKLASGQVSLDAIARAYLLGADGSRSQPRLGELCKKLREQYGAVPLLVPSQLQITSQASSARNKEKLSSFDVAASSKMERSDRKSVRLEQGWAERMEQELTGKVSKFEGGFLGKRSLSGLKWKLFYATLQNQYLNLYNPKTATKVRRQHHQALMGTLPHSEPRVPPIITYNLSKLHQFELKTNNQVMELVFKQTVGQLYKIVLLRAPTTGEAITWYRSLRLRQEVVLLRDETLK